MLGRRAECVLKEAEQVAGPGQSNFHRSELTEDLAPFAHAGALLRRRDGRQNFVEWSLLAVGRELNDHEVGVDDPPQDNLDRVPGAVALL